MKIDVILTPGDEKNEEKIHPGVIVVAVDVLRVSTTIATAVENGASSIYPTFTVQEAFDRRKELIENGIPPNDILLGGERESLLIPGFDMGNSPLEYSKDKINGKILILSSTNGTKAIKRSGNAFRIITGCIRNAGAVAEYLTSADRDVVFYLSGRIGEFSLEDAVGAGVIIGKIQAPETAVYSDSALVCMDSAEKYSSDLVGMFKKTFHGKYLESLGLGRDLEFCAEMDRSSVVPVVSGDALIKKA
jgi:2-phosphosulfolactate phosphatase